MYKLKTMPPRILGRYGESIARQYLEKNNYKIISKNYRLGHKEIDLIATKDGLTICFEIKTRQTENVFPEDCLSRRQTKRLRLARAEYSYQNRLNPTMVRGDLIIILSDPKKPTVKIKHYRDVF
jgi:putative endonuclease